MKLLIDWDGGSTVVNPGKPFVIGRDKSADIQVVGSKVSRTHLRLEFTGSHWNSRKANEIDWFEPYADYQIFGTNQFCQTFAMMYLADKLPSINADKYNFTKYYTYTIEALKFIEEVINAYPSSTLKERKAIKECIKYPNVCLNSIEFP